VKATLKIQIPMKIQKGIGKLKRKEEAEIRRLVVNKLKIYLRLRRFEAICRRIRPYALKAGIRTDEDAFRVFERKG